MTDFNATLKRAFAEAHEPADDGFTVAVTHRVARREKSSLWLLSAQGVGIAAAAAAIVYGLMGAFGAYGAEVLASFGLEVARAHGALTQASAINLGTVAAGLTQIVFVVAGLAGGAVVYRTSQARWARQHEDLCGVPSCGAPAQRQTDGDLGAHHQGLGAG
jgi:uncharacterized membrane protein YuzA (DUF378 family)